MGIQDSGALQGSDRQPDMLVRHSQSLRVPWTTSLL